MAFSILHLVRGFLEIMLLLHGLLHDLSADEHFVLHGLQLGHQTRLLFGLLRRQLPLLLQLFQQALLLLVRHVLLLLNLLALRLGLPLDLFPLLIELSLHRRYLLVGDAALHDSLYDHLLLDHLLDLHDLLLHDHLLLLRLRRWRSRNGFLFFPLTPGPGGILPAVRQLLPQTSDLVLELADHRVLWVLVDARFVLDAFGPVRVAQRAQGLVVVVIHGTDARAHDGLRVAA
mmetsp:Transcript_58514/g.163164  ORF Transcript_58514/g.163164 Transcript_58514/m.163164 type:complete len:231 (-) Transcript_58514:977-1669(-)